MADWIRKLSETAMQTGLPSSGVLADGTHISAYDTLDEETLRAEGWLPLVDEGVPPYDPTFYVGHERAYVFTETSVRVEYTPVPAPPRLEVNGNVVTYYNVEAEGRTVEFTVNGAESTVARVTVDNGTAEIELAPTAGMTGSYIVNATGTDPVEVSV